MIRKMAKDPAATRDVIPPDGSEAAGSSGINRAESEQGFRKAMIAATLLAPSLASKDPTSLHSSGMNELFRSALERATDLLQLADVATSRMVQAYQLFTPDEHSLSSKAVAARFKVAGWHKMTSAPTVKKVLDAISQKAKGRLDLILELRRKAETFDPERPSLAYSDYDLAEQGKQLAIARLKGDKLGGDPEQIGDIVRSILIQLLGMREHLEDVTAIDGYELDLPYLAFLVTRCVPDRERSSARQGYFPYELFLYASIHEPKLVPPIPSWELKPEFQPSDPLQNGLSPAMRIQDIWSKIPVAPQYFMEGVVRRFGNFQVDLTGMPSPIPAEGTETSSRSQEPPKETEFSSLPQEPPKETESSSLPQEPPRNTESSSRPQEPPTVD